MEVQKLDPWANKLLDLSRRNNLINYRSNRTDFVLLPLRDFHDISELQQGGKYTLLDANKEDGFISPFTKYKESANPDGAKKKRIFGVETGREDFQTGIRRLKKLTDSRLEESGVNATFVACGFLEVEARGASDKSFNAPIVLIPIVFGDKLNKDSIAIELSSDEAVVNPALIVKLRDDFGIEIPKIEDATDWSEVFAVIEDHARDNGWSVRLDLRINLFSFQKIAMYEDLTTNASSFIEHPIIRALLGEISEGHDLSSVAASEEIDFNPLLDLVTVIDADSSQIEAIQKARGGASFALQGPPGTGKSQTIANIVADQISAGKKVLFVSEKRAALNVVFEKLTKLRLDDSCLELHSDKVAKGVVIAELMRTLELPRISLTENCQAVTERKREVLRKLDAYTQTLHQQDEEGRYSLYDLFAEQSRYRLFPKLEIESRFLNHLSTGNAERVATCLAEYSNQVDRVNTDYRKYYWYGLGKECLSYQGREGLKSALLQLRDSLLVLKSLTAQLNISDAISINSLERLTEYLRAISATHQLNIKECRERDLIALLENRDTILRLVNLQAELYKRIAPYFTDEVVEIDTTALLVELESRWRSWFKRFKDRQTYESLIAPLSTLKRNLTVKVSYSEIVDALKAINEFRKNHDELTEILNPFLSILSFRPVVNQNDLLLAFQEAEQIVELDARTSASLQSLIKATFFSLTREVMNEYEVDLRRALEEFIPTLQTCSGYFPPIGNTTERSISSLLQEVNNRLARFSEIDGWMKIAITLDVLDSLNSRDILDACISSSISIQNYAGSFNRSYYEYKCRERLDAVPHVRDLTREQHDSLVSEFRKLDNEHFVINQSSVRASVSQYRPNSREQIGRQSQILVREAKKKRAQKSVRKLFTEIPELIQGLKPCILMSPLSVATFIPPTVQFDLVIFDEASQVFPHDAIGAISRGKQVIVVGDSKQMPPSDFFKAHNDPDGYDEEETEANDFESILDLFSSSYSTLSLRWHYRSKSESLIAFSNYHFYANSLITFPDTRINDTDAGVSYEYVPSGYDNKSGTNRPEAQRVVELVLEHYSSANPPSLGVVCSNQKQQNLIDDLLYAELQKHPEIYSAMKAGPEHFFVKNLESVQGDERDYIIFSTVYGPDSFGNLRQHFGPLNREGGERRLNVAVTRARSSVKLVSSMRYGDIRTGNSKHDGVRLLREYLRYAELGTSSLGAEISSSNEDKFDSEFEMEVCDFLRERGFVVNTQVGCSGYRIDLAVRQSETENYCVAVECDGASYHSSKNARDRDRIRQTVLENMGWSVYRIWSTNWFQDRRGEENKLLSYLEEQFTGGSNYHESDENAERFDESISQLSDPASKTIDDIKTSSPDIYEASLGSNRERFESFEHYTPYSGGESYSLAYNVAEIILSEAPITKALLIRRINELSGNAYSRGAQKEALLRALRRYSDKRFERNGDVWFVKGKEVTLRRSTPQQRDLNEVPICEIAAGMKELIRSSYGVSESELFSAVLEILGRKKLTKTAKEPLDKALRSIASEISVSENGCLTLKTGDDNSF